MPGAGSPQKFLTRRRSLNYQRAHQHSWWGLIHLGILEIAEDYRQQTISQNAQSPQVCKSTPLLVPLLDLVYRIIIFVVPRGQEFPEIALKGSNLQ